MAKNRDKIRVASLFSGAGGIDLGMKNAGLEIVYAVDNCSDCVETYKNNIDPNIFCEDIKNVNSADIPDCDIVIGGFPCQGFSMANRFREGKDSRNSLYLDMLKIIKDKQPKWFLAENVKGILSLEKGEVFKMIASDFEKAGYRITHKLINMADYGVPQARKRVIILGTRNDLPEQLNAFHPEPTHNKDGSDGKMKWISIGETLKEIEKVKKSGVSLPNDTGSKYKVEFRNFTGHRQTNPDMPSPTILARGNGQGGVCAIPHPNGKRRLTIRESASVQSFPLTFEFYGSNSSMYRQIGNAVPVLFGEVVGKMLIDLEKNG